MHLRLQVGTGLPEMNIAAHLTLDYSMTFESLKSKLHLFEGWALRDLASFRKDRRDEIIS